MRDRRRRDHLRLLGELATAQAAAGELDDALTTAQQRLALDVLQEESYRHLMILHTWRGDRSAVTDAYLACVRALDEELGVPPLAETDALYRSILGGTVPQRPTPQPAIRAATAATAAPDVLPFVGRTAMMARLRDRVARARSGHGGVLTVVGRPGVGKTRLLDETVAALPDDHRVGRVRCEPAEAGLAYAPIVTLLRRLGLDTVRLPDEVAVELARLVPSLGPAPPTPLDSPISRARFADALTTAIVSLATAEDTPGLLVVDDLHQTDPATRTLLAHLAARLARTRVLLLVTTRVSDVPAGTLDDLIRLTPLDLPAVRTLVTRGGFQVDPDTLFNATAGVPFRIAELLRLGPTVDVAVDDLPVTRRRVAACSDLGLQVLVAVAAVGGPASARLTRAASGRGDREVLTALDELVAAGLLRESDDEEEVRYIPAHEHVRDVVLADTSRTRRRLLHGRVADALVRADPPAPAAVLAMHLREAGREAEAATAHAHAGRAAFDLYANLDAVDHLTAAVSLGHPDGAPLLLTLADAQVRLGRYAAAAVSLTRVRSRVTTPMARARADHRLGGLRLREGDPAVARAHLEAALAAPLPPSQESRVRSDLAQALLELADADRARDEADRAVALAAGGNDHDRARACNVAGLVARRDGRVEDARELLAGALTFADSDVELRIAALNNLALVHVAADERREAVATAREAWALGHQLGDRHREAALSNNLADILHAAGDEVGAQELQTRAAELFASVDASTDARWSPGIWRLVDW